MDEPVRPASPWSSDLPWTGCTSGKVEKLRGFFSGVYGSRQDGVFLARRKRKYFFFDSNRRSDMLYWAAVLFVIALRLFRLGRSENKGGTP